MRERERERERKRRERERERERKRETWYYVASYSSPRRTDVRSSNYKKELVLNNLKVLICHKIQPTNGIYAS